MKGFRIGKPKLQILPISGIDAVGDRNCLLLSYGKDAIVLDCGQKIPLHSPEEVLANENGNGDGNNVLGDEYYPDFSKMRGFNILAVLVSHGHLDHIGGLGRFMEFYPDSPIVTSRFTLDVIRGKLLQESRGRFGAWDRNESTQFGPFEIRRFPVLHSIPGSSGFLISVGGKNIVYTGDIKTPGILGRDEDYRRYNFYYEALQEVGDSGVDFLISDATNADEPGYAGTEERVYPAINRIVREARGRVFIALVSSNVKRIQNIIRIAKKSQRQVYAAGYAMREFLRMAGAHSYIPVSRTARYMFVPPDAVFVVTGSQGEAGSFLDRLSRMDFEALGFNPGISSLDSLVISADTIPIREIGERFKGMAGDLSSMFGRVFLTYDTPEIRSRGARIERIRDLHVTGHGKQGDFGEVLERVGPKVVIPFHAELRRRKVMADFAEGKFGMRSVLMEAGEAIEL